MLAGYARESHNRNHPRDNYHDDEYYSDYYYYYYYYYHHAHGDEHQQEDVYHRRRGTRAVAPTPPLDLTPLGHWARSDAPYPDAESRDSRANLTTVLPGSTRDSRATLTTATPRAGQTVETASRLRYSDPHRAPPLGDGMGRGGGKRRKTQGAFPAHQGASPRASNPIRHMLDPYQDVKEWLRNHQDKVEVLKNPGEGDCLFHAMSQALERHGLHIPHLRLRRDTARYMQEHPEQVLDRWDGRTPDHPQHATSCETFEAYIRAIQQPGAWAGEMELIALSHMFPAHPILIIGTQSPPIAFGSRERALSPPPRRMVFWLALGHFELVTTPIPEWIWQIVWGDPGARRPTGPLAPGSNPPPPVTPGSLTGEPVPVLTIDGDDPPAPPPNPSSLVGPGPAAREPIPTLVIDGESPQRAVPAGLAPPGTPVHRLPNIGPRDPQANQTRGTPDELRSLSLRLVPQGGDWWLQQPVGTIGSFVFLPSSCSWPNPSMTRLSIPQAMAYPAGGFVGPPSEAILLGPPNMEDTIQGHPSTPHVAVLVTKIANDPLTMTMDDNASPLSGIYPRFPDGSKRGLADLACGIGGFTFGGHETGWSTIIAVDDNASAVESYRTLHGEKSRCIQADLFSPDTLRTVNDTRPAVISLGFPCQPYSPAGHEGGFSDDRSHMLQALLIYAAVLRPRAMALENVRGFCTLEEGYFRQQLKDALEALQPSFDLIAEVVCLSPVRPIRRSRWLAMCPRKEDWLRLPEATRFEITGTRWSPECARVTVFMATIGIPRDDQDLPPLRVPDDEMPWYLSQALLPEGYHSRFVQDWDLLPALTHCAGSELRACPCGCRPRGLSTAHLMDKGIFATLVRLQQGARLLSPIELAQLMGFPRHALWSSDPLRLRIAHLGNAVSPMHAARALGRITMMNLKMAGEPIPAAFLSEAIARLKVLADARLPVPSAVSTPVQPRPCSLPTPAEASPTPSPVPAIPARCELTPAEHQDVDTHHDDGHRVSLLVTLPSAITVGIEVLDTRAFHDLKVALLALGHTRDMLGFFVVNGRPQIDSTQMLRAEILSHPSIVLARDGDHGILPQSAPWGHRGGLCLPHTEITQDFPGARGDVWEFSLLFHPRAQGTMDVQAGLGTSVDALVGFVAALLEIPARLVDLTHPNCDSIADHGDFLNEVPGLSLWDTLCVHRWIQLQVSVVWHACTEDSPGPSTALMDIGMEVRSDVTGTSIWRRLMVTLSAASSEIMPPEASLVPVALVATSPLPGLLGDGATLWNSDLLLLEARSMSITAHLSNGLRPRSAMVADLLASASSASPPQEPAQPGGLSPTLPWPPPEVGHPLPPMHRMVAPPGRGFRGVDLPNLRGGAVPNDDRARASDWVAFMESVTAPSADYVAALRMVRRTQQQQDQHGPQDAPPDPRGLGWDALSSWDTLRQVLVALEYEITGTCPWRRLGVPRLEGPTPSAGYIDLRLRKALSLLQAGLAAGWPPEDQGQATALSATLQQDHALISSSLGEILRLRRLHERTLAPPYAEASAPLLQFLHESAVRAGPNCRLALMLSNIQETDLSPMGRLLGLRDARMLQDALLRGPEHGVPALRRLSDLIPRGRILVWAPSDNNQTSRYLSSYEAAAAQGMPLPDLSMLVLCETFPGVTCPRLLLDLWKPSCLQRNWDHLRDSIELLHGPARCVVTGGAGPREVTKTVLVVTFSANPVAPESRVFSSTTWKAPLASLSTGPVLQVDGPAEQIHLLQRAVSTLRIPHVVRWEGPLRSLGTAPYDRRALFKVYFEEGTTDLALDVAVRGIKAHKDLGQFLVGNQRLFSDPAALRLEVTAISSLTPVNALMEHTLVVSPKLALMLADGSPQDEWTRRLTELRRNDPENAISAICWRSGHHGGAVWALPEALPAQSRADRVEAGRRRRPIGTQAYFADLVSVSIQGSLGPSPNLLLTQILTQIQTAVNQQLQAGQPERALPPYHYSAERDGEGNWSGSFALHLPSDAEIRHICEMLHGAVLEIGQTLTPIAARNPRMDSTASRLRSSGDRRGGRQ